MRIIVVGATGTIGKAVADALAEAHEVLRASRHGDVKVDIADPASVASLFERVRDVDAVVSCAGDAKFAPLASLTDEDFASSLRSKLMGQVNLVRHAQKHLRDGGSVTVTSGILSQKPIPGSGAVSLVNAGLEGFVRAAALESPRGIRVNVVSPPWVTETLLALKMDPSIGLPSKAVAKAYLAAVLGKQNGETLSPAAFL